MRLKQRLQKSETMRGMGNKVEIIVVEGGDDLKSLERQRFGANGAPSKVLIRYVNVETQDAACA